MRNKRNENMELDAYEIAFDNQISIKKAISKWQGIPIESLHLFKSKKGVYFSERVSNLLCCFVVWDNGHMYLVSAKYDEGNQCLLNYK